jgi:hypothetical protein
MLSSASINSGSQAALVAAVLAPWDFMPAIEFDMTPS